MRKQESSNILLTLAALLGTRRSRQWVCPSGGTLLVEALYQPAGRNSRRRRRKRKWRKEETMAERFKPVVQNVNHLNKV